MTKHLNDTFTLPNGVEHPEIYVVCKASYQDGDIYGVWIDTTQPMQDILKQIALMQYEGYHGDDEMLSKGYCPDLDTYFIHSHIGFYDVDIYGNAKIEDIRAYAIFIAQYGELGAKLIRHRLGNLEEAKKLIDEGYLGSYKNQAAFDYEEDYLAQIPERLRFYAKYKPGEIFVEKPIFAVDVGDKRHIFRRLTKLKYNAKKKTFFRES